jgi:YVTN family beta-propeller protein
MRWRNIVAMVVGLAALLAESSACGLDPRRTGPVAARIRQPVALALVDNGKSLLVANRRSGTISLIDLHAPKPAVREWKIGRGLNDLAALPDGRHLLAVDEEDDELILLRYHDGSVQSVAHLPVSADPVRVAVLPDNSSCVVAARWSRKLTFVEIRRANEEKPALEISHTLDFPFSPQETIALPDGSAVIVADAFGGHIALVDTQTYSLKSLRSLPAHNIRGLALAPGGQTLAVAHQVLNPLATTSFDDIHWGSLMSNELRLLKVSAFFEPGAVSDPLAGNRLIDLGDVGQGAGDPGAIFFDSQGAFVIALSGVGEVAIGSSPEQALRRVTVGARPTAIALSADGSKAYVADTLDDTISVIDTRAAKRVNRIALGPRPELGSAERGERLFYDARMSHHGWLSCHSCHTDGHTNGRLADTLGDESYGTPKLVPTLLGVSATTPWGWLGNFDGLGDQVRQSITTTIHGPNPTGGQVGDIVAFLHTLEPPPRSRARTEAEAEAVERGSKVFRARGCARCHVPQPYTSQGPYDVGLADEAGHRKFNPPSLRGASRRERFLHDGRAQSLHEVLRDQGHPKGTELRADEIDDVIAFLKSI